MPPRLAIVPGGHGDHSEVTVVDAGPGGGGVRRAALGLVKCDHCDRDEVPPGPPLAV
jgi:hypothetical protein